MGSEATSAMRHGAPRTPSRGITCCQLAALAAAGVIAILTLGDDHWSVWTFTVIAVFTVVSSLTDVETKSTTLWISGSGLGIIAAAVLLGGGPAALVGVLAITFGWLHSRENIHSFLNNLVAYSWSPLLAGLFFTAVTHGFGVGSHAVGYYLLVFADYMLLLAVNFLVVVGYSCYVERVSLAQRTRAALIPLLSAHLFSALLAMGAIYLAHSLGNTGLAVLALTFVIFQYLVGELLKSQQRSEELQRIVTTDELTGLANRERFREVMEERISDARGSSGRLVVMLMDLDRFKEINDTLGHHYGDVLLRDLGPRLVEAIGDGGLVARLGGDEFGILPPKGSHDIAVMEHVASQLTNCVSAPFVVDELSLEVGVSIGIARFPEDGDDSHALLRCADIAMYAAKDAQCDYKLYAADQNQHSVRRLSVLSDIRHALSSEQIVVHYQPIVDVEDLTVTGAEGLVRWQHPELGLIPPGAFVQTVEQTGLIGPLTRYVLERSIAECSTWRQEGRDLSVAVNLSVRNLLDRDLPKEIERLLSTYSLPPEALELEITESMIMSDPERAMSTVTRLSGLGVRMSVDDFGTGYSSLANLRRLPIKDLKIDRSFVSPMLVDESDLIIVRSTINLGHDLGLRVIAEGVEDAATLQELALLGCDLAQGYHVSRPMAADAFEQWLRVSNPRYVPERAAIASPANGAVPVVSGSIAGVAPRITHGAAPGSSVTVRPAITPTAEAAL